MNDLTHPQQTMSLVPRTMDEAIRFATTLSKSDIVPKDFLDKPANILVAIQWGFELGLQPMQAMQSIAVINGRPSLWGDAVIALVRSSDLCEYIHEEIAADGMSATCRTKRKGDDRETVRTFTMEDAEKAGLKGKAGPWTQYRKRMLQMRARSWCLRDVYPDVLRGVHVAEEAQDIPPEKDVTPHGADVVEQPRSKSEKQAPVDAQEVTKDGTPKADVKEPGPEAAAQPGSAAPAETAASSGNGATAGKPLVDGQLRIIRAKLKNAALTETDLVAQFGAIEQLRFDQFDPIQDWISARGAKVSG